MLKKIIIFFTFFSIFIFLVDKLFIFLSINTLNIYTLQNSSNRSIILREIIPDLDYNIRPDSRYISETQGLENKLYKVKTDSDGFIVNSQNFSKDKTNADIIFYGGSTTELLFIDEEYRFPSLVEKKLSKYLDQEIVVKNAGVSGNNSMHTNLSLIAKGIKYSPKIAFLFNNINDLKIYVRNRDYWNTHSSFALIQDDTQHNYSNILITSLAKIKDFWFKNLWDVIVLRIDTSYLTLGFDKNKDLTSRFYNDTKESDEVEFNFELAIRDFENSLQTFINICKAWNIQPVLITQPTRLNESDDFVINLFRNNSHHFKVNLKEYIYYHKLFNEKIRHISNKNGLTYVDLEKEIDPNPQNIYDHVHFTVDGSKEIANIIFNHIKGNYINLF